MTSFLHLLIPDLNLVTKGAPVQSCAHSTIAPCLRLIPSLSSDRVLCLAPVPKKPSVTKGAPPQL